jgi:hypothetical protein
MALTEFDIWTFDPVSTGGGGMGQITGDFLFTEGSGDVMSAAEITEAIVNRNGNGGPSNGNGSPLGFASSAGGAFILGLVILAMSGFRG